MHNARFGSRRVSRPTAVRAAARRNRGFSLLELVVVVCAIALLATLALERFWAMRVDAERVAMEQVVGTLRSALGIKVANYLANGDLKAMKTLEGSNPMDRLSEVPENYLGALADPDPASVKGGHWYFDLTAQRLVYRVRHEDHFSGGASSPARAQFAVKLVYGETNRVEGVRLAVLEPYTWVE